jgi:hypothetical protein
MARNPYHHKAISSMPVPEKKLATGKLALLNCFATNITEAIDAFAEILPGDIN